MYTKEQLIEYGWKYYNRTNKVPSARRFTKKNGYVSRSWIYQKFKNWDAFIESCNFPEEDLTEKARRRTRTYNKAKFLEDKTSKEQLREENSLAAKSRVNILSEEDVTKHNTPIIQEFKDFLSTLQFEPNDILLDVLSQFEISGATYFNISDKAYSRLLKKHFKTLEDKPNAVSYNRYALYLLGYKRCSTCKRLLTFDNFSKYNTWDKLRRECRECYSNYYNQNIEYFQDWFDAYYKENKADYLIRAFKRSETETSAMPKWLSSSQIEEIKSIYKNRPADCHVDHIIPLKGDNVCGLHVPWNLQYLTQLDNLRKGNKL